MDCWFGICDVMGMGLDFGSFDWRNGGMCGK